LARHAEIGEKDGFIQQFALRFVRFAFFGAAHESGKG